jgi:ATP phosphoribosyltransferase
MISDKANPIRLSLPSKGRLADETLKFLDACGLPVYKPNPRQYEARIPDLPGLVVLFQRPGDIVVSVREGSVDFGISGLDMVEERKGENNHVLVLHDKLTFGHCTLTLAVPERMKNIHDINGLKQFATQLDVPLRVATKFPELTRNFLSAHNIPNKLISAEGTLETAPAIGYADIICDLVSSGQTLRDNRLRSLKDGMILMSQAALIANRHILMQDPEALQFARHLLEYFEAHIRATENVSVFANMRGSSAETIAEKLFNRTTISGLQGPTVSKIIVQDKDPNWFAIHIVVRRSDLFKAISELRSIGGSGVVVSPLAYIFEEEPPRYTAMLRAISDEKQDIVQPSKGN